ncbi:hypothetical protein, partial [Mycobacterium tuberculosis]|uniref:hypothetical protein n=1 Tax=Mycobacterium tuberculosis TaxID=1773 RepID=UPI003DA95CAD
GKVPSRSPKSSPSSEKSSSKKDVAWLCGEFVKAGVAVVELLAEGERGRRGWSVKIVGEGGRSGNAAMGMTSWLLPLCIVDIAAGDRGKGIDGVG